jgi:hypothetical protein
VEWALEQAIETATFHILTPYPGTALHTRLRRQGRITSSNWDRYDTRHAVFSPQGMSAFELEAGYREAYRAFYRWGAIARSAAATPDWPRRLRHLAYAGGWKKFEALWNVVIRAGQVWRFLPALERVLDSVPPKAAAAAMSGEDRERRQAA